VVGGGGGEEGRRGGTKRRTVDGGWGTRVGGRRGGEEARRRPRQSAKDMPLTLLFSLSTGEIIIRKLVLSSAGADRPAASFNHDR
jgi:hypothetical protein